MRILLSLLIAATCLAVMPSDSSAAAQDAISHQGRLTTSTDSPVPDGPYPATFSLWTDSTGGTQVWTEMQDIQCSKGLFSCQLGKTSSFFDIFTEYSAQDLWLQTQVMISGSVQTLLPRMRIGSVPYARGAYRLVDDTISTNGVAILAGVAIPKFIEITAKAARAAVAVNEEGVERCLFGTVDGPLGSTSTLGLKQYDPTLTYLVGDAVIYSSSVSSGHNINWNFGGGSIVSSSQLSSSSSGVSHQMTWNSAADLGRQPDHRIGLEVSTTGTWSGLSADIDGDGVAEHSAWEKVDNSAATVSAEADVDDDGTPDVGTGFESTETRTVLKSYFETGDIPTESQRIDTVDGTGVHSVSTVDLDGDGHQDLVAGCSVDNELRDYLDMDSDDDGVADRSMSHVVSDDSVSSTSSFFDITYFTEIDQDCDGNEARMAINTKGLPGRTKRNGVQASSRADGSTEIECVSLNGLPPGTPVIGRVALSTDNSSSSVSIGDLDRDGLMELRCTPDSVVQTADMSDGSSSSSYQMRTRVNDIETKLINLGLLATTTIRQQATPDSAVFTLGYSGSTIAGSKNIGLYVSATTGQCGLAMVDATMGTQDTTIIIDGNLKRFGIGVGQPDYPIHHSSGAHLTAGGTWTNASDENLKENFKSVDGAELLEKIDDLPISQWNYKIESDEVTHIGPTAQDFKKTFGVGENDKTISTIDPSGIALAAIKQLSKENNDLKAQVAELKKMVEALGKKK